MSQTRATSTASDSATLRAAPAGHSDSQPPARLLDRWLLEEIVGESTFSRVHRARPNDRAPGANSAPAAYAIKMLREEWQDHPVALSRIRGEGIVGRCVGHRHLVPVLAAHIHRPPYYVVMPLIDGVSVAARLAAERRLAVFTALWIIRQAAEALECMHTMGYIHGDVTPANMLSGDDGYLTLIDLGCACRFADGPLLEDAPLMGTPQYLSPEVLAGSQTRPASDLYSLGVSLYEMLAGRLPREWSGDLPTLVEAKRGTALPNVREFIPNAPSEVGQLVRQLTARDPLRRPHTAGDVVRELVRLEVATLRQRVA